MLYAITFAFSLVVSSLIGQGIHWALHQAWTGRANRGHMQHHLELYPPEDLTSAKYRKANWQNTGTFLFAIPFLLIVATMSGLAWLMGVSQWFVVFLALGLGIFGLFNDAMHDSFHLKPCWLSRFAWYREMQRLHFTHHVNMQSNFGIVVFVWDKLFGTFSDEKSKTATGKFGQFH